MRPIALILAAVLGGCGSTTSAVEAEAPEDVDPDEAVQIARDTIGEIQTSIRLGTPQGVQTIVADDVFAAGPHGELHGDKGSAVAALTERFGGGKHKVKSRSVHAVAGPGGRSAWVAHEVDVDGARLSAIVIVARDDGIWRVAAAHVARPVAAKVVNKGGAVRPPPLTGGVGPGADAVAATFAMVTGRAVMRDQLADRDDVIVVGSAAKDVTLGATRIRKRWDKAMKKKKTAPTFAVIGDVRAGATLDGQLGWVCANVEIGAGDQPAVPHRGFYVYERAGDDWRLVAVHEAVITAPNR
jgi:hypothetical protein